MRDIMGIQRCVEEVAYITYIYHTIYSCNNNYSFSFEYKVDHIYYSYKSVEDEIVFKCKCIVNAVAANKFID